jgi:GH18 family chitinase
MVDEINVVLQGLQIIVFYKTNRAVYRPGNGKFDVEDIDPMVCTHLIYGFVGLSPTNEILVLDPYNDEVENWGRGKSIFLIVPSFLHFIFTVVYETKFDKI